MIGQRIIEFVQEYLLCRYNPDRHTLPDRRTKNRNSDTDTDRYNLAEPYTIAGGKAWVPDNEFLSDNAEVAWQEATPTSDNGRAKELTDKDLSILKDRNLDIRKAKNIKPIWALGTVTIPEISRILTGKYGRGYGQTTVATICAAFSSALSPTEEAGEGHSKSFI